MIDGALVLPEVSVGVIEASATRSPAIPCTPSWLSTTASGSDPILQVPDRVIRGFDVVPDPVEQQAECPPAFMPPTVMIV